MKNPLLRLIRDNLRAIGKAPRADMGEDEGDDCMPPPLRVDASGAEAQLYLYGFIDEWFGVGANTMLDALAQTQGKPVCLHVNSPGGDVFEGTAIATVIAAHGQPVRCQIGGMCASAATRVALACRSVAMSDSSLFMIHNAWTLAWGDKHDLAKTAELLGKVDSTICADYMRKTGKAEAQVVAWMDAETWFTAADAKAQGFVDEITATTQNGAAAQASAWNLSAYRNAPKPPTPPAPPQPDAAAQLRAELAAQHQINRNRLRLLAPV